VSSNFGYAETIKGRDENNRSSRVINRADGSVHGHVWLPTGECAAFIIDSERVYVGVDRNRGRSWEKARSKFRRETGGT
jgi:hypothetical protein